MTFRDLVEETTDTVSTGPFVLSGVAAALARTFGAAHTVGEPFDYCAKLGNQWEVGIGVLTDATHMTRTPTASSNAGALVDFAVGTKRIYETVSASSLNKFQRTSAAAFATAIPLTAVGATYMPQQAVASVLAFTIAPNPVQGALVYVRLVANGTHAPTFTGMKEWGSSMPYDNRNGIVNVVQFLYDGNDYWYSISQAVGAVAIDGTAPVPSSAVVANSTPTIVSITHSEALDPAYVPATSAYTVSGHTVSAVAVSGSAVNLTCTAAFVNGEAARTWGYTPPGANGVRDLAGNLLGIYSAQAITNSVGAVATGATLAGPSSGPVSTASTNITLAITPIGSNVTGTVRYTFADGGAGGSFNPAYLDLSTGTPSGTTQYTPSATAGVRTLTTTNNGSLTNPSLTYTSTASAAPVAVRFSPIGSAITEGGSVGAYTYVSSATGTGLTTNLCVLDKSIPADTDGSLTWTNSAGTDAFVGVSDTAGASTFGTWLYSFIGYGPSGDAYHAFTGATDGAATGKTNAPNDINRITRTGTTLTFEYARAGSQVFVTIATFTGVTTARLYFKAAINVGPTLQSMSGVGLT